MTTEVVSEATHPVLDVREVVKTYGVGETAVYALRGVSLAVERGDYVAVMGASGSGKSTLLHLLGGLDRPSDGKIYFGHREITALAESELARFRNTEIGFVWQTHYLLPEFTALENVMMPLLIRGTPKAEAATARVMGDHVRLAVARFRRRWRNT